MSQVYRSVDPTNVFLIKNGVLSVADPAEELFACRGCLATNVKLFDIRECELTDSYQAVLGLPVETNDGFPQHLCPHCFALLQKYEAFKERCHRSLNVLRRALNFGHALTTEFLSVIDRDAELVSMPLAIQRIEIDHEYFEASIFDEEQIYECQEPPVEEDEQATKVQKSAKKKKPKKKAKDEPTFPVQKLLSRRVDAEVLEDNPFAKPGSSVFRKALALQRQLSRSPSPSRSRSRLRSPSPSRSRTRSRSRSPLARQSDGPANGTKETGTERSLNRRKLRTLRQVKPIGYPGCAVVIRVALEKRNTAVTTMNTLLSSLTPVTLRHYNNAYIHWWEYCGRNELDPFKLSVEDVRDFLIEHNQKGKSLQVLQNMRSALAFLLGKEISTDSDIARIMRIARAKVLTYKSRFTGSWDPAIVLTYLSRWYPNEDLTLEQLSRKVVVLLALVTEFNSNDLSRIQLPDLTIQRNGARISVRKLKLTVATLSYFPIDRRICPVTCLVDYVRASEAKRPADCTNLFINVNEKSLSVKASYQTIGRWVHKTLIESGVDLSNLDLLYSRSEVRPYKQMVISLDVLRKQACWTDEAVRFAQFYNVDTSKCASYVHR